MLESQTYEHTILNNDNIHDELKLSGYREFTVVVMLEVFSTFM